jgi:hypothetical protein
MISFEDSKGFSSIVGTNYKVKGYEVEPTRNLQLKHFKKHFKRRLLFFRNPIVDVDYRDGRQKNDIVWSFKARSTSTQCIHMHFPNVL